VDFNRISRGGKIVAIAGLLFFVISFTQWHRACFEGLGQKTCGGTGNAWQSIWSLLATLIIIALIAEVLAVEGAGVALPPVGGVSWGQLRLGLAGFATALVVVSLIIGRDLESFGFELNSHPGFGVIVGLVLAALVTFGEYQRMTAPALPPAGGPYGGPGGPGYGGPGYGGPGTPGGPDYGPGGPGYGGPTPPPPPPGNWNPNA
jgi:hypothetical protein